MPLDIVILAAGQGKRMHSALPKVLHPLAGKPLLQHVIDAAEPLNPRTIFIVYSHGGDLVRDRLAQTSVEWVHQKNPCGTGDAVRCVLPHLTGPGRVLVLCGDVPLIQTETLQRFIDHVPAEALGVLTAHMDNPKGLGRVLRDREGGILKIIEERDATDEERLIQEINTGILLLPIRHLDKWLSTLEPHNAQNEYYLTDLIAKAQEDSIPIVSRMTDCSYETRGINDRSELAVLERFYQKKLAEKFMQQGVAICDPNRVDIRGELVVGEDCSLDIDTIFEGKVVLGNRVKIGPFCYLKNVTISDDTEILAHSVIEEATIGHDVRVGPFSRIRPGTVLSDASHIGNFCEIKNSLVGENTKINHLSYIGDTTIGQRVNIGAGTITCNYDGKHKYRTVIEDDVFIGSDSQLIAPVTIREGATIGAGSTVTKEAPSGVLTLSRAQQKTIVEWKSPRTIDSKK